MLGVCAHPWQRSGRRSLPQAGLWWKCRRVVSAADVTETPRVPAVRGVKVRGGGRGEGVGRKSKLNIAPEQRASCAGRSATQYSNFLLLMDLHTQSDPYRPPPPPSPRPPPPPTPRHTPAPSSPLPLLPVLPRTASLISLPLASHRRVSFPCFCFRVRHRLCPLLYEVLGGAGRSGRWPGWFSCAAAKLQCLKTGNLQSWRCVVVEEKEWGGGWGVGVGG